MAEPTGSGTRAKQPEPTGLPSAKTGLKGLSKEKKTGEIPTKQQQQLAAPKLEWGWAHHDTLTGWMMGCVQAAAVLSSMAPRGDSQVIRAVVKGLVFGHRRPELQRVGAGPQDRFSGGFWWFQPGVVSWFEPGCLVVSTCLNRLAYGRGPSESLRAPRSCQCLSSLFIGGSPLL